MKLKSIILVFTLFLIYFIFNSFSYSHSISNNLEENLFRLRVVANSNSKIDQDLKIKVRNSILNYLSKFNLSNKEDTILHLKNHQTDIETIISNIIKENGFDYTFQFEISNSFYPAKKYNSITLPSGNYDGLQIKLGNAKGENWWCILFPPMCLINSSTCELEENSNELLSNNLSNETTHIIQSSEPKYKFKFKIIDFINNL